jgi:hypothetical protein
VLPSRKKNFKDFLDIFNQKIVKGKIKGLEQVQIIKSEIIPCLSNS